MDTTITIELAFAVIAAAAVVAGWVRNTADARREMIDRLARLETMMERLSKDVEKHNRVIERTFKVESDLSTAFKRIDEIRDETKEKK